VKDFRQVAWRRQHWPVTRVELDNLSRRYVEGLEAGHVHTQKHLPVFACDDYVLVALLSIALKP
jgi:hypothetical protein